MIDREEIEKRLTNLYNNGELPSRDDEHVWVSYYIKHKDGYIHSDSKWNGYWGTADRNSIESIIGKVPNYEDFMDMVDVLYECGLWFKNIYENINDEKVGNHNGQLPIKNFENVFKLYNEKIDKVLKKVL